ncbi:hypothetical protein [Psychroserpens sp.]|uniref:hypothetical protein n=1 Tax=Psychroserpens sp. TaxID=2020870 RepID=UPI001B08F67B|nr:hypothetical protein [Psychroserpens sp.]MBO6606678.1 hypothetical protein [Psychroserpens sp.]MBO6632654.1 hypothetical protein [Psychroserpens sp.]MBO6653382.1 hypothetical protein [Psychroserpens sp.]MBO6680591.1 hypothetical protein [Psychroserpens sp.]MBO6750451.1 hypothetical protein [Psychroserpens sp.]
MRKYLIILLVLISSCNQDSSDWIDRTKHEGLYNLDKSTSFETYCTEENPKNIENTIKNLEQAKSYFDKIFKEDLNFAVLFVDNSNWNKYAFSPPPGMPQAHYQGNMVLGLGNSVMSMRANQGLKQVPDSKLELLKQHFGKELNLDLFYRDALSLHELGHLYQFHKTGKGTQRHWLNEIFGNLCQVAGSKNLNSQDVFNQMDVYQLFLINSNKWGELKFKTLEQFENDYFEILKQGKNYGWYQTQFYLKAKELYATFGDKFVTEFRDFLIEINPDRIGRIDDKELNELMSNKLGNQVVQILEW